MASKEINIFNISFLDLLSGALGAVIILYVIIPKLTQEQVQELIELETLREQVQNVDDIIEELENSIPRELYEQIESQFQALREQIEQIRQTVTQLESRIENLQNQLSECQQAQQQLQQQVQELEEQVENLKKQLQQCQIENQSLQSQNNNLQNQVQDLTPYKNWMDNYEFTPDSPRPPKDCNECIDPIDITFIVVSINWETQKQDIDLWVIDPNGKKFYYSKKKHTGIRGLLSVDDTDGPGLEVFQVVRAYPGDYKVYYHLYSRKGNNANPEIKGWIYYPKGARKLPAKTLTNSTAVLATTITVQSDGTYTFQDH